MNKPQALTYCPSSCTKSMSSSPSPLLAAADRGFLPSMLRRRRILLCMGGESPLRDTLLGWLEEFMDTERWN